MFQDVTALDTAVTSTSDGEMVFRYRNPERPETEGFAWSFLRNTGRRSVIRGSGLLVHRYDFSIDGNSSASKLGLRIAQADGKEELQAAQWPTISNDSKDFLQSGTVGQFDDIRFPSLRWYNGKASGVSVSGIGTPSTTLSFQMGPQLPAASATTRLEAEKAQVVNGAIKAANGASGGSYASTLDNAASKVVFTVNRSTSGRCSLLVRFANGGTRNASHVLIVNGSVDSLVYRPTGAWARFDSVVKVVELFQGRNQIILGKKTDAAELDAISLGASMGSTSIDQVLASDRICLRRIDGGHVEAPAWMAGSLVEFRDLSGRILGQTKLGKESEGKAVGDLPPTGAGTMIWRTRWDDRTTYMGVLVR